MIGSRTQGNLVHGLEVAFPWLRTPLDIARHFNVPRSTVENNPAQFDTRLTRQQGCATFHAARNVREFITDPRNLRLLANEVCLHAYVENTLRHVEATVIRRTSGYAPGLAHMVDAAHRHHVDLDRQSRAAGVDKTIEGVALRVAKRVVADVAPDSDLAASIDRPVPKFIDFVEPLAGKGEAYANRIDINTPDAAQRVVGDLAGSAPSVGAAFVHPALGAVAAAGDTANLSYDDAIAHGATVEQAEDAALLAGLTSAELMFVPGGRLLDETLPSAGPAAWRAARPYVASSGAGAVMTGGMGVGENLAARATYDPDRPISQGAGGSALGGAVLGSTIHASGEVFNTASRDAGRLRGSPPALDAAINAVRETTLRYRAPDQALALLRRAAPHTDVVIPAKAFADYIAGRSASEADSFVRATGIGDQLQADPASVGEIRIPTATYVFAVGSDVAPTAHEAFSDQVSMVQREGFPLANSDDDPMGPAETEAAPKQSPALPALGGGPEPDSNNTLGLLNDRDGGGSSPVGPADFGNSTRAKPIFGRSAQEWPWAGTLSGMPRQAQFQLFNEIDRWRRRPLFGDLGFGPLPPRIYADTLRTGETDPNDSSATEPESSTFTSATEKPLRGLIFVPENLGVPKTAAAQTARDLEDGTPGAFSDTVRHKRMVPALQYDNPNPRGRSHVKFDGYRHLEDGTIELIDRKTRVLTFKSSRGPEPAPKVREQLLRQARALKQNSGYRGVIEVPDEIRAKEARAVLRGLKIRTIIVRVAER